MTIVWPFERARSSLGRRSRCRQRARDGRPSARRGRGRARRRRRASRRAPRPSRAELGTPVVGGASATATRATTCCSSRSNRARSGCRFAPARRRPCRERSRRRPIGPAGFDRSAGSPATSFAIRSARSSRPPRHLRDADGSTRRAADGTAGHRTVRGVAPRFRRARGDRRVAARAAGRIRSRTRPGQSQRSGDRSRPSSATTGSRAPAFRQHLQDRSLRTRRRPTACFSASRSRSGRTSPAARSRCSPRSSARTGAGAGCSSRAMLGLGVEALDGDATIVTTTIRRSTDAAIASPTSTEHHRRARSRPIRAPAGTGGVRL